MTDLVSFLFVAQTATLILASLLLAYPVVAYARNVAYTRGFVLLSGAFFVVTATYVATFLYDFPIASAVLDLVGATLAGLGTWQFARPFVRVDRGDVEPTATNDPTDLDEATGGFESAGDD